jgi:excisionase family DNA binding protein
MMTLTFSLEEAGDRICGDSMKDPAAWVRRKIRAGTFRATKVGRHVRMTEEQIDAAVRALEMGAEPDPPRRLGITPASLRRRAS